MAIYTMQIKTVSRSSGHSATAKIAYNCRDKITDSRSGEVHKYNSKKMSQDLLHSEITYKDLVIDKIHRSEIWNNAELAENRKDSRTAREYVVALPKELSIEQNINLVRDFAKELTGKYNNVADWAIHNEKDENGNIHAHILTTTREFNYESKLLGERTAIEWNNTKCQNNNVPITQEQIKEVRKSWETIQNKHLSMAGLDLAVSCERKEDRKTVRKHLGKEATALERKGIETELGNYNRMIDVVVILDKHIANDGDKFAKINAELELLENQKKEQEKREKQAQELQKILQVENGKKDEQKTVETPQNFIKGKYKNELFNVAFEHNNFFTKRYEDNRSFYESIDKNVVVYKDIVRVRHITESNIKLALDSAISQFGNQLTLTGSDKFIGECLQNLANDDKYNDVQLNNPAQQLELDKLRAELQKNKSLELINNEHVLQHFEKINPALVAKIRKDGCVDAPWCYVPLDHENPEKLAKYLMNKCDINVTLIQPSYEKIRTETAKTKSLNLPDNESVLQYFEKVNPELVMKIRKDGWVDVPGCFIPLDCEDPEKLTKYLINKCDIDMTLIQISYEKIRNKPLNLPNNESVLQYFEKINPELVAKIRADNCVDVPNYFVRLGQEDPEELTKYLSAESGIEYVAPDKERDSIDHYYGYDFEM